jgi:hypothetical protein
MNLQRRLSKAEVTYVGHERLFRRAHVNASDAGEMTLAVSRSRLPEIRTRFRSSLRTPESDRDTGALARIR